MSGEETVQIPASVLEKMQAQLAALTAKVGIEEDEILDPEWPRTVYRQNPQADVEPHDHVNFHASFEAKTVASQEALDAAMSKYDADENKDGGWSTEVPKCWLASYVPPKPPKAKK